MVKPTDPKSYQPGDPGTHDRPMTDRPLEGMTPPPTSQRYESRAYETGPTRPYESGADYARRERYETQQLVGPRVHHQAATARISWGALLAGLVTAVVLQILFTTLGMAVGLSTLAVDPNLDRSVGVGAGIWWLITGLISLFAAGWVAARVAGIPDREDAMIHGFVTWGLATLFGAFIVTSTVGTLVGGTMGMLNNQLAHMSPQTAQAFEQRLNQMQDQGEVFPPPVTNRSQQNPNLTPQQQQQVQQTAERAAEVSAPALWMTFLALLLGAGACIGGAYLGTPKTTTAVAIGT
jgi:hypothetical protein